ncbi:HEPN domain-containing protein [Vreelandella subterranea]|uniref:HEPN domain-containing protein n=1 Tax=Vreelandella subterranea TaxID=416874 RepID=A0A1H9WQC4_9GAMM|nr:HEPN domain-containing protein [Halomonas subterranea]SES36146.1 HEPN domain-containing protein [Halomonas subterranea]
MTQGNDANPELRKRIYEQMHFIDDLLAEREIPIHKRFMLAGRMFVDYFVKESTFDSKEEFLSSEAYRVALLPIFNDWYWDKYGELAKGPGSDIYCGIVLAYNTPVRILVPATTSRVVEPGKLAKLTFPDRLEDYETIEEMLQTKFDLDKMPESMRTEFKQHSAKIVGLIRSINIDLNMASNLALDAEKLSKGIWSHMEKAANDILTLTSERASIACWDIHIAVEKTLKVLINDKKGKLEHGHNLKNLAESLSDIEPEINGSMFKNLPTDKDAIKLRYAEEIKSVGDAVSYYHESLEIRLFDVGCGIRPLSWARI